MSIFLSFQVKSKYPGISYFVNVCSVTSVTDDNCKDSGVCRAEKANGKTVYRSLGSVKYQKLVFDTVTNTLNLKYLQDSDGMLFYFAVSGMIVMA